MPDQTRAPGAQPPCIGLNNGPEPIIHQMKMLLCIGNIIRADDGAGPFIARWFEQPGWEVIDCGTAPENFTGLVRKRTPELLVIADAADMGLPPGSLRRIPATSIADTDFGTHQASLALLAGYLGTLAGEIVIIGIQPEVIRDGIGLSPAVESAARELIRLIGEGRINEIPLMKSYGGEH
jgi:hydrogenase 3 maturation protease